MAVSMTSSIDDSDPIDGVITGVRDPRRLKAVADADLAGHLGDPDLDAVVATLRLACESPIVVVNIVGADLQTYAAEFGAGAPCTSVPDGLHVGVGALSADRAVMASSWSSFKQFVIKARIGDGGTRRPQTAKPPQAALDPSTTEVL